MGLDFKNFPGGGGEGQTKSATVRFFPGSAPVMNVHEGQLTTAIFGQNTGNALRDIRPENDIC